jgi:acyl-CoA synthetase (AMP-forming)/AMP-acid ligase II
MYDFEGLRVLADISRQQARTRGGDTAMVFQDSTTTFAELDRNASRVANGLIALAQPPQARIGYFGKNSDRYFEVMLGALKANTVTVGVNWRLAAPEVAYVLNDAGCEVLFADAEFAPTIENITSECPRLRHRIVVDHARDGWSHYPGWRDAQQSEEPDVAIMPDDDAIQLYTSGTTGHPKGVQLTNANYLAFFRAAQEARWGDFQSGDANLVAMPNFHVAGTNMGLATLAQGAVAIIQREVNPIEILDLIARHHIRSAFLVPAVIAMLVQHPRTRETDLSSLHNMFYGASPIAEALLTEAQATFAGCGFTQLYGLTETVGVATALQPADHIAEKGLLRSCGKPYPGIEVKTVDAAGRENKPGEVGEIVIRGGVVMKGYWNKPEATAAAIRDGWFHTGDAGYFDAEGYLYIHDRIKDMIVSGAENIYPAEVENALFGHPAVADVAVIGVPDDKWGEAVKAVIVLKPGAVLRAEDLIAFARARIAGYKVPKSVDFVAALPRNPSGKILRRELREAYWAGKHRRVN